MIHAPTAAAIDAAELRVALAKQRTRDHARRARLALNQRLSRPSTWAAAAGAAVAAVGGAWLIRNTRSRAGRKADAAETSTAAVVVAFAARYAAKFLVRYLGEAWLTRSRKAMECSAAAGDGAPTGLQAHR